MASRKPKADPKKFWELLSGIIKQVFVDACDGDEIIANEAMIQYAMLQVPEAEHDKIRELSDIDLEVICAQMAAANPDALSLILPLVREAATIFFEDERRSKAIKSLKKSTKKKVGQMKARKAR